MNAEQRKKELEKLGGKLDELWELLDYGYLLGDGPASRFTPAPAAAAEPGDWHCGQCSSTHAALPAGVQHEEGCIIPAIDAVINEWRALAGL